MASTISNPLLKSLSPRTFEFGGRPKHSSGSDGKESKCNPGDPGLIPGWGISPGEGNGYPLEYSSLENSMDRGAWQAIVHGVTRSRTQLSGFYLQSFNSLYYSKLGPQIAGNSQERRPDWASIVVSAGAYQGSPIHSGTFEILISCPL